MDKTEILKLLVDIDSLYLRFGKFLAIFEEDLSDSQARTLVLVYKQLEEVAEVIEEVGGITNEG